MQTPSRSVVSFTVGSIFAVVVGCSDRPLVDGPPTTERRSAMEVGDAVPKIEPLSRYGNPSSYVVFGKRYYTLASSDGFVERGIASWYGTKFHGRRTSSGEPYDMYAMTAAHKSLPLPTYARVTHLGNGKSIVVRINDRGPFHGNRIIDLSYVAAGRLGMLKAGTAPVEVRALDPSQGASSANSVLATSAPPRTRIYLQVGAFAKLENAETLRRSIAGLSADVESTIAPVRQTMTTLYRVRLGPLASVEAAELLSAALFRAGIEKSIVVLDSSITPSPAL